jgi:Skp family chaperone for outer membrane proteins
MRRCGDGARLRIFDLKPAQLSMKRTALIIGFIFVASIAAAPVFAQAPGIQTRPQAPVTNVPVSKVAVIFSEVFQDPKAGIAKFTALLTKLSSEFQKTQADLNQMAQTINQLNGELNQTRNIADPKVTQQKIDQLDQLKKDYQRKGEDAQAAYKRRRAEILGPLQDEVGKALDAYAKSHLITLIIDASQVPGILYASESIDITKVFISDYNLKNPATASATTPK